MNKQQNTADQVKADFFRDAKIYLEIMDRHECFTPDDGVITLSGNTKVYKPEAVVITHTRKIGREQMVGLVQRTQSALLASRAADVPVVGNLGDENELRAAVAKMMDFCQGKPLETREFTPKELVRYFKDCGQKRSWDTIKARILSGEIRGKPVMGNTKRYTVCLDDLPKPLPEVGKSPNKSE